MAICLSDGAIPLSKSIVQRVLLIRWLAEKSNAGTLKSSFFSKSNPPENGWSADNIFLYRALRDLTAGRQVLSCGEGGTTLRFLAALSAIWPDKIELTGCPRLAERPIEALLLALRQLGVGSSWRKTADDWFLTLEPDRQAISATTPEIILDCSESSQFCSALLLVAPYLSQGLLVRAAGRTVSWPYVEMTIKLMRRFGAAVGYVGPKTIKVHPGAYVWHPYTISADWSAAAFVLAAAWLSSHETNLPGCICEDLQPDQCFSRLLEQLQEGQEQFDLHDCPDLLPVMAVCALFSGHECVFSGIAHTELKESARASLLAAELVKVGADVTFDGHNLTVSPAKLHGDCSLAAHGDHRLAMAFGLLRLRLPQVMVTDRDSVAKSFPGFWQVLELFA